VISVQHITFLFQHGTFTLCGTIQLYFGLMSLSHFERSNYSATRAVDIKRY